MDIIKTEENENLIIELRGQKVIVDKYIESLYRDNGLEYLRSKFSTTYTNIAY